MSEKPILREARAAVFAVVCVLVGVVGHDAFSLGGVPVWLLAACAGVLYIAVRPLTTRERGLPGILGAMAVVQLGLHQVFATAQQHMAVGGTAIAGSSLRSPLPPVGAWWCGPHAPTGLAQLLSDYPASMLQAAGVPTSSPMSMGPMGSMGMNAAATHTMGTCMLTAHVAAALIAAWWLRRGEASAWSLARALTIRLLTPLTHLATRAVAWTPPKPVRSPAFPTPDRFGPAGLLIRFAVARRGPPLQSAAFC